MPKRFKIFGALCVLWWIGLTVALDPFAAITAFRAHGADSRIATPPPSTFDFYRSGDDVQADSVLRQRRAVATRYVGAAQERLDLFSALATMPPTIGLALTAAVGWLRPAAPAPARSSATRGPVRRSNRAGDPEPGSAAEARREARKGGESPAAHLSSETGA